MPHAHGGISPDLTLAPTPNPRGAERMETRLWAAFQACPESLESQSEPDPPALAGRTGRVRKQVGASLARGHESV